MEDHCTALTFRFLVASPKNACVGGYVSKKPIKKSEALFVHACQVWDV